MSRTAGFALAFVAATGIGLFAVNGGGAPASDAAKASPEAMATDAFNSGVKHLNNGDKAELKAATEKAANVEKAMKQGQDEYGKDLKDFQKAVALSPKMHRAYNGL